MPVLKSRTPPTGLFGGTGQPLAKRSPKLDAHCLDRTQFEARRVQHVPGEGSVIVSERPVMPGDASGFSAPVRLDFTSTLFMERQDGMLEAGPVRLGMADAPVYIGDRLVSSPARFLVLRLLPANTDAGQGLLEAVADTLHLDVVVEAETLSQLTTYLAVDRCPKLAVATSFSVTVPNDRLVSGRLLLDPGNPVPVVMTAIKTCCPRLLLARLSQRVPS